MRPARLITLTCFVMIFATAIFAQQAHLPAPAGTVAGTVTCEDTQHPARFAQVMLFGIPSEVSAPFKADAASDPSQFASAIKSSMSANLIQTQTGIDGQYSAADVPPGDYYVFAAVAGYLPPASLLRAAQESGADLSKPVAGIPTVHVAADRTVRSDLTVTRGAAVSGRVVWDDGSPVTHAVVTVTAAKGKEKELPPQFGMLAIGGGLGAMLGITDDLGHFRLSGLTPADYLVQATLQTHTAFAMMGGALNMRGIASDSPLIVYAPSAFHRADAKPVTLHTSEDRSDIEITLNLAGMHSVSGTIASAETHHPINSGAVKLEDTTDKGFSRFAMIDANGTYTVTFIPAGTYTLTIDKGADTEPAKDSAKDSGNEVRLFTPDHTLRSYDPGKLAVIVTDSDVAGQNLELTPSKTTKRDIDVNGVLVPSK